MFYNHALPLERDYRGAGLFFFLWLRLRCAFAPNRRRGINIPGEVIPGSNRASQFHFVG